MLTDSNVVLPENIDDYVFLSEVGQRTLPRCFLFENGEMQTIKPVVRHIGEDAYLYSAGTIGIAEYSLSDRKRKFIVLFKMRIFSNNEYCPIGFVNTEASENYGMYFKTPVTIDGLFSNFIIKISG